MDLLVWHVLVCEILDDIFESNEANVNHRVVREDGIMGV